MSRFETIAKTLGNKKLAFFTISLLHLVSSTIMLMYYVGVIFYYFYSITHPSDNETFSTMSSTDLLTTTAIRKVQTGPSPTGILIFYAIIFSFPVAQLVALVTSVVWLVYNLTKPQRKILLNISMFGTVLQVLICCVSFILCFYFIFSTPIPIYFIVSVIFMGVLGIWSLLACFFCAAQIKWWNLEELRRKHGRNYHERTIAEEQVEDDVE